MNEQLPDGWVETGFTKVFDIQGGTQPPKSSFVYEPKDGYVRLLQIRDFGEKPLPTYISRLNNLKFCKEDDILIARYGASIGRIVTGMSGAYNVALAKVIIPEMIFRKYVYHLLRSKFFQEPILAIQRSAQDGFNKDDLQEISLPLPPLAEQARIVTALDGLMARVRSAQEQLATVPKLLKRFRHSVLSAAVSGQLTEEWRGDNPDVERAEELLRKIIEARKLLYYEHNQSAEELGNPKPRPLKLDSQPFASSDYPEMPDTWTWTKLLNLAEISGGTQKGKNFKGKATVMMPYLRVANVQDGYLELSEIRSIEVMPSEKERYLLAKSDILFTEGGDRDKLGRGTIWNNEVENCVHQNHIFKARTLHDYVLPEYISLFTKSDIAKDYFLENATQTTNLASMSISVLSGTPIALPPFAEQKEIIHEMNGLMNWAEKLEEKYKLAKQQLDALPAGILAKAFAGELTVQDPADEPALVLLERIRAERLRQQQEPKPQKAKLATDRHKRRKKMAEKLQPIKEILASADAPVPADTVWKQSVHKDDIEAFYADLKQLVDVEKSVEDVKEGNQSFLKLTHAD